MTDNQPVTETPTDAINPKGSKKARNSAARLLAVQAVFQILSNKNEQSPEDAVKEFLAHRAGGFDVDGDELVEPDKTLFKDVVIGVFNHFDQLHEMVDVNRSAGKKEAPVVDAVEGEEKTAAPERPKEPLLYAHFLCGAFELMIHQSIDAPIIINDYLHAARAFYDDAEVKLINAVLDGVKKTTR